MTLFARSLSRVGLAALVVVTGVSLCTGAQAQDKKKHGEEEKAVPSYYGAQPANEVVDLDMYGRIRAEGL